MKNIKLLVLDVDGVLTDGTIYLSDNGTESKRFHIQDGQGIKSLQNEGIRVAIISSRESQAVNIRMKELGVDLVYQGQKNKDEALQKIIHKLKIELRDIAYMGDDLADLPAMEKAGLKIAPANAVEKIKKIADWITKRNGGDAAVREVCDRLLSSSG